MYGTFIIPFLTDYVNRDIITVDSLIRVRYPFKTQRGLQVVAPFVVKQKVKQEWFRLHKASKINA